MQRRYSKTTKSPLTESLLKEILLSPLKYPGETVIVLQPEQWHPQRQRRQHEYDELTEKN